MKKERYVTNRPYRWIETNSLRSKRHNRHQSDNTVRHKKDVGLVINRRQLMSLHIWL